MTAAIHQLQKKQEAKFECGKCGADRHCDCNAPAVEKLAEIIEQRRKAKRAFDERKRQSKQYPGNITEETTDDENEEGLRVIAARGFLNRATEAAGLASADRLRAEEITDAMIQAAERAASAWNAVAQKLRGIKCPNI